MKNWEKYSDYLGTGDFHVHTDHTEGASSVQELCEQAETNGLRLICFAEHVRRKIYYSYEDLLAEIIEARKSHPRLVILPGCEAKVLDPDGNLDVSEEILDKAEIVVASFHSFSYASKRDYMNAVMGMLNHPRVDIWGHPATFLRNTYLSREDKETIINECIKRSVLIEDSLAKPYRTHPEFIELAKDMGATIIQNSDAHHRNDLKTINGK